MKKSKFLIKTIAVCAVLFALAFTGCRQPVTTPENPQTPGTEQPGNDDTNQGDNTTTTTPTLKSLISSAKDGDTIDLGSVDFTADDKGSYSIKANNLTLKNGNVKNATFIVEGQNVKFENLTDIYTVIVDESVGDADFDLKNCHRVAEVYLNGGGSNSVHISSTEIGKLVANKQDLHIQFDEDGATKIEKVYILQDCSLDSKNSANTLENILVSDIVEKLKLDGEAKIDKIISDADSSTTKIEITVNVNITIIAADTVIQESIKANAENEAFNNKNETIATATISAEEKKELEKAKDDAGIVIVPDFSIDVTSKISPFRTVWIHNWISISDLNPNGNIKVGDKISVSFSGTFANDVESISMELYDIKNWDYNKVFTTTETVENINANELATIKKTFTVLSLPDTESGYLSFYMAFKTKDNSDVKFIPKDWETKTWEPNLEGVLYPCKFGYEDGNYQRKFEVTDCFFDSNDININSIAPRMDDTLKLHFSGVVDKDIPKLYVYLENEDSTYGNWAITDEDKIVIENIKAGETFNIDAETIFKSYARNYDRIKLCLKYDAKDLDDSAIFTLPGLQGKTYTPDLSKVLYPVTLPLYSLQYDITDCFTELPQMGDIVEIDFKATFDNDVKYLYVWLYYSDAGLYIDNITPNTEITINGKVPISSTPSEGSRIYMGINSEFDSPVYINTGKEENFEKYCESGWKDNKAYFNKYDSGWLTYPKKFSATSFTQDTVYVADIQINSFTKRDESINTDPYYYRVDVHCEGQDDYGDTYRFLAGITNITSPLSQTLLIPLEFNSDMKTAEYFTVEFSGENAILDVESVNFGPVKTLWTGEQTIVNWGEGGIQIPGNEFADCKVGDIVITKFEPNGDWWFRINNEYWVIILGNRITESQAYVEFTAENIDDLKEYGLVCFGSNITYTDVYLYNK